VSEDRKQAAGGAVEDLGARQRGQQGGGCAELVRGCGAAAGRRPGLSCRKLRPAAMEVAVRAATDMSARVPDRCD
jgi:hypothetical protein